MAINVEIIEAVGAGRMPGQFNEDLEMPAVKITNVDAASRTTLQAGVRRVQVRNRTGGDSVYVLPELLSGAANAAVGNSMLLAAGQSFTFTLPKNGNSNTFCVDIRAAA